MPPTDPLENRDLNHLQSFIYLIPVLGFFPALWTLYRQEGTGEQRAASRAAVLLTLGWVVGSMFLGTGVYANNGSTLQLLILASLLTSGYFLVNLGLMVRLWLRKPLWGSAMAEGDRKLPIKKVRLR